MVDSGDWVNPLTTGSLKKHNKVLFSFMDADGLVIKHQGINIYNTGFIPVALDWFNLSTLEI